MAEVPAHALTDVGGYRGDCLITAGEEALSILSPEDRSVIASWQYGYIRKFRTDSTENLFIFTSGSHGPFGVKEYRLELAKEDLSRLQSVITATTGAQFSTVTKSPQHNTEVKANAVDVTSPAPELETSLRNPMSPSLTNPQACLERVRALAQGYETCQGDEGERRSRVNVYTELVNTERDYVGHLKTVIDAYYDAMDPESVTIPLRLRGKRDIVFGNLQDIYKFHDTVFCQALEFFKDCPERVGDCFMQFAAEFELYTVYCKNHPKSEVLVNGGTECQAFFKGIQRQLGHKLDLNAYLLTPVQRITKYQLLLKDLLKHSADMKNAVSELEAAYNKMCRILKELNDSMYTAGLTGLPDDLPEPGKLLAHDPFQVVVSEPGLLTFSRSREKHVFLFEKVIIISKKTETVEGNSRRAKRTEAYVYKEHLDMTAVTLRECVDGHPLLFGLSLHKQAKEYRFEAVSVEVQQMWVSEIRRLLHLQFAKLKMQKEKATFTPPSQKKVIDTDLSGARDRHNSYPPVDSPDKRRSAILTEKPPQIKNKVEADKKRKGSSPPRSPPPSPPDSPAPNPPDFSPPDSPPPIIKEPHPYENTPYQLQRNNDQSGGEGRVQRITPRETPVRPERKSAPVTARPVGLTNGRKRIHVLSRGLHIDNSVDEAICVVHSKDLDPAWCVCGYHDNSELVVLGKGNGPVEEIKQYLHDDIIAFGLLKVVEVVDSMPRPRLVYVEWIGVKSRLKDKANVTTHRPQLEQLFKPYHADIFATSRADISERIVMDRVTNISGSRSRVV